MRLIVVLVASWLLTCSSLAQDELPDKDARRAANELVQEVFGEAIQQAKTAEQRRDLVQNLLKEARQPDTTASDRYAILMAALEIAPDASTAMSIIDEIVKQYRVDEWRAKEYTISKMSAAADTVARHRSLANAAANLMDEAIRKDKYDHALRIGKIALVSARQAQNNRLAASIETKMAETMKQKTAFDSVKAALETLEKEPTNPQANAVAGKYKCFTKGDWKTGLAHLALGDDADLKDLAVDDLKEPASGGEQVTLGDRWWDIAQQSEGAAEVQILQRARFWYSLALKSEPRLSRLIRVKVENRLKEIPVSPPGPDGSSGPYECRSVTRRGTMVRQGGTPGSETAVSAGLQWLAEHQNNNGSWSWDYTPGDKCSGFANPGEKKSRMGPTGMALMPFLAAGHTHQSTTHYEQVVKKGLNYLVSNMVVANNAGKLFENGGAGHEHMYSHGIAACALAEAYGMTRDPRLKTPAQRSINYIVNAQHPANGGWLYEPRQGGDTSVVGWQVMALKSAAISHLTVPGNVKAGANHWLTLVQTEVPPDGHSIGAQYGYRAPGDRERATACTAIGLLCRMYLGTKKDDPGLLAGVKSIADKRPSADDMYYNYYASMLMYQADGPDGEMWKTWNEAMRDYLIRTQVKEGKDKGSWHFTGGHGSTGGRVYNTAMSTMTLEVYYRYPLISGN